MEKKSDAFGLQYQIKQNATEMSDYLQQLRSWETSIKQKDKRLQKKYDASRSRSRLEIPVRNSGGRVEIQNTLDNLKKICSDTTENIDVTPATIAANAPAPNQNVQVPKPSPSLKNENSEETIRAIGNDHFRNGEFTDALKYYTRCLCINSRSVTARSNRAMTYLKLKEFQKGEDDCSIVLQTDPGHIKTLLRRASARNSLGKHRAAIVDLKTALALHPKNKEVQTELRKSNELFRSAIRRAPKRAIQVFLEQRPGWLSSSECTQNRMVRTDYKQEKPCISEPLPEEQATLADSKTQIISAHELSQEQEKAEKNNAENGVEQNVHTDSNREIHSIYEAAQHYTVVIQSDNTKQTVPFSEPSFKTSEEETALRSPFGTCCANQLGAASSFNQPFLQPISEEDNHNIGHTEQNIVDEDIFSPLSVLQYFKQTAEQKSPGPDCNANRSFSNLREKKQQSESALVAKKKSGERSKETLKIAQKKLGNPKTGYAFEKIWRSLVNNTDGKKKYIEMIDPATLPALLKNILEADLLCDIVCVVKEVYLTDEVVSVENWKQAAGWLSQLSLVPRFKMTAMLLNEQERIIIGSLFQSLELFAPADIENVHESIFHLKKTYNIEM